MLPARPVPLWQWTTIPFVKLGGSRHRSWLSNELHADYPTSCTLDYSLIIQRVARLIMRVNYTDQEEKSLPQKIQKIQKIQEIQGTKIEIRGHKKYKKNTRICIVCIVFWNTSASYCRITKLWQTGPLAAGQAGAHDHPYTMWGNIL